MPHQPWRFSLRTLLVLTGMIAVYFGLRSIVLQRLEALAPLVPFLPMLAAMIASSLVPIVTGLRSSRSSLLVAAVGSLVAALAAADISLVEAHRLQHATQGFVIPFTSRNVAEFGWFIIGMGLFGGWLGFFCGAIVIGLYQQANGPNNEE